MAVRSLLQAEFARFGAITVLGLAIDLLTGLTLARHFGVPLAIAAVLGFAAAASMNYVLHELWTFRRGARRLSFRRGGLYLATLCLTLGARIGTVLAVQRALPAAAENKLATLLFATGISFVVNYGLSRYLVFSARPTNSEGGGQPRSSNE